MIHIDLPDGRWLELCPLLPDDELEDIARMSTDELITLPGLTRIARVIERFCEDRSAGLADMTAMPAHCLVDVLTEWATRSTPPIFNTPVPTGVIH